MANHDITMSLRDSVATKLLAALHYPTLLYKIPGRINIDPLDTKGFEIEREPGSSESESAVLELRSMEIFRFEVSLRSAPKIDVVGGSLSMIDVELKVAYELRIHYKLGPIKSHIDFKTSEQIIQSNLNLQFKKSGSKLSVIPSVGRLKLVFTIAGFKVTLDMLKYLKLDLGEKELIDTSKILLTVPILNASSTVKEFDFAAENHLLSVGLTLNFKS